jgi:truncated hemoglobin YjbI
MEKSPRKTGGKEGENSVITAEQRAQIVDLLTDGLPVWQVADRTGVDRQAVAHIKTNWRGRILGMQRERLGQRIDGTPMPPSERARKEEAMADAMTSATPTERIVTIFAGDDGRIAYTMGDPAEALIRVELGAAWDDEAIAQLCRRLGTMRDGQLERLAQKISGGGG